MKSRPILLMAVILAVIGMAQAHNYPLEQGYVWAKHESQCADYCNSRGGFYTYDALYQICQCYDGTGDWVASINDSGLNNIYGD